MMMSAVGSMVKAFHTKMGLSSRANVYPNDEVPVDLAEFRQGLLQSEVDELQQAVSENDLVEIADALADIIYVAYGTALTYGINVDEVLYLVHQSNMTKSPPTTPGGKAVKGPDYRAPDVSTEIYKQRKYGSW